MRRPVTHTYEFGSFHLDVGKRLLLRDGKVVPLTPKAFDTLLALVEQSGQVVGKGELMRRVWPDSFVEESNLTFNIHTIRQALGEHPSSGRLPTSKRCGRCLRVTFRRRGRKICAGLSGIPSGGSATASFSPRGTKTR